MLIKKNKVRRINQLQVENQPPKYMMLEQLNIHMQKNKMNLGPKLTPWTKVNKNYIMG